MHLKSLVFVTLACLVLLSSVPESEGFFIEPLFCLLGRTDKCVTDSDAGTTYTVTLNYILSLQELLLVNVLAQNDCYLPAKVPPINRTKHPQDIMMLDVVAWVEKAMHPGVPRTQNWVKEVIVDLADDRESLDVW
ncbi:unnamed protein product [Lepeophtheirus salmonis]|uniref:(salmon louse) hypothetical protein n=1 Tax=Lepeophtheirus salmonis TaxID=72036 RepID=A0A7R8CJC9_LEPSM|nr:unnamed protein product [Lepeophtheirus salmonis]CAF2791698.1 unnamed protein product [Lepeophtheirus salmonis]